MLQIRGTSVRRGRRQRWRSRPPPTYLLTESYQKRQLIKLSISLRLLKRSTIAGMPIIFKIKIQPDSNSRPGFVGYELLWPQAAAVKGWS